MNEKWVLGCWVLLFSLSSCREMPVLEPELSTSDVTFSFFVAGHTYGSPTTFDTDLYLPFKQKIPLIESWPGMKMGFLTGDFVQLPQELHFDHLQEELKQFPFPVHLAPGNHDSGGEGIFYERFGRGFYSFKAQQNLFILLDPNREGWNISTEQLGFLDSTLNNTVNIANIFVFFHQLLWWEKDNLYSKVEPNSFEGRKEEINFWTEIEPRFVAQQVPVYMFAGDLGAVMSKSSYFYHSYGNIHLIGSGMGSGTKDNFLIVELSADNVVNVRLIALKRNIDAFGTLVEFIFP